MGKFKKYALITGLFLALLTASFLFGKCSTKKDREQQIANIAAARDSISTYSIVIEGLSNTVSIKDAIILTKEEALKAQVLENERLKALHVKELVTNAELTGIIKVVRDSLKARPETIFITIKDTAGVYQNYAKLPFTAIDTVGQYLSLKAGVNKNKTSWFSLSVPVSGEMSIGYVKAGFLKQKPVGIFTSENPYLKVTDMDILIVKEDKHFYNKTWFHLLSGAILLELGHQLLIK
jgi:hypothetical protein